MDSSSSLGMIQYSTSTLKEFCGTRVGEIKRNNQKMAETCEADWLWCPGENNPADRPSRGVMDHFFIESNQWLHGPQWLEKSDEYWPTKNGNDFTLPNLCASEEVKHIKTCLLTDFKNGTDYENGNKDDNILKEMSKRCGNLKKLLRVIAFIIRLFKFKGQKKTCLDAEDLKAAEAYWINEAMKLSITNLQKGNYKSLRGYLRKDGMVACAGRLPNQALKLGYDVEELLIIESNHIYTKLFIKQIHQSYGHPGVDRMADLTRTRFWILNVRRTATSVWKNCILCKKVDHRTQEQLMGKIKAWRAKPAPVFNTLSIDLFGPMEIKDNVIKRVGRRNTIGKCWGIVLCCTATGAINIDVTEDYSTYSTIQAIRRHICDYGSPTMIITDRGSQLQAAQREVNPDWSIVAERLPDITWIFSPSAGHHYNGIAEAFVKRTKRCLEVILQGADTRMTFGELVTFCKEAKNMINSRPLGPHLSSEDPESLPLTPNHLLIGRGSVEIPQGPFTESRLNRRYIFVQNLISSWWKRWYCSIFPYLIPSHRWTKKTRNLEVGDTVLINCEGIKRGTYQLGRVTETFMSDDGFVRRCKVDYVISGCKKTVEKSITFLVLLIPHDYKNEIQEAKYI